MVVCWIRKSSKVSYILLIDFKSYLRAAIRKLKIIISEGVLWTTYYLR